MNFNVKTLIELACDAFKLSIELSELGKTKEAYMQYGRGTAFEQMLRSITGWVVKDFAPEVKELDYKACINLQLYRGV